jgi:hypothetical protein
MEQAGSRLRDVRNHERAAGEPIHLPRQLQEGDASPVKGDFRVHDVHAFIPFRCERTHRPASNPKWLGLRQAAGALPQPIHRH